MVTPTPTTVQVKIQLRSDTSANWASVNPVLLAGEMGLETNTNRIKIGNGSTAWNSLGYFPFAVSGGTVTGNLEIGTTGTLTFEGSSADNFETTLGVINPTADRTINLPNVSGTIITTGDTGTVTSTMIADGTIVNADVSASAAIAHSKLANITAGYVLIGNASNVPTATQVTGDVTISDTGVTAISSGVIVDADVSATAEIAVSKLANGTANQVIVTDGTNVSWSDDLTLAGNLTVNGTTTTINTQDLLVEDKNIIIGNVDTPSDVTADGGGITLKGATDKTINWVDATDAWTSSERFSVPLGSAASPSLTFTGDENTGIYSPGADQLALSTNGTGRLFVDATGNVGVNKLPGTTLDAQSTGANCVLSLNRTDAATAGLLQLASANGANYILGAGTKDLFFSTNSLERLRITSDGKLGVGTSSPAAPFHLVTPAGTTSEVRITTGNATAPARLSFYQAGAVAWNTGITTTTGHYQLAIDGGGTAYEIIRSGQTVYDHIFSTSGSERLRITSAGLVGIGTSSPDALLKVVANDSTTYSSSGSTAWPISSSSAALTVQNTNSTTNTASYVGLSAASGLAYIGAINAGGFTSNIVIGQRTASASYAERLRIDSSGRVGIGTTSPAAKLNVVSDSSTVNPASFVSTGVANTTTYGAGNALVLGSNEAIADATVRIDFYTNNNSSQYTGAYMGIVAGSTTNGPANIVFGQRTGATTTQERMRLDTSGRLLVGTSSAYSITNTHPATLTPHLQASGADENRCTALLTYWANGASGSRTPSLALAKSDGAEGVYTAVASEDKLGEVSFHGADGSAFKMAAAIHAKVDGTPGADDMPGRLVFLTTADGASSPTERMRITQAGEVYIAGTTDQGAYNLQCNGTGVWGAGAYVNGSDESLKENIQDLEPALDVIKAMRPVTFQYKEDYSKDQSVQPGFIAQELREAMAGMSYLDGVVQAGPEHLNVAYQGIIAILVKAVQELEAKVAALESA